MGRHVVLCSGGFDSAVLAHMVRLSTNETVILAFIDYDQKNAEQEWESVKNIAKDLCLVADRYEAKDLFRYAASSILGNSKLPINVTSAEIPSRNLVLCSYLSSFYSFSPTVLYIGAHKTAAPYADCTPKFYKQLNKMLKIATYGMVSVQVPFIKMTKQRIADVAWALAMTPDQLRKTVSCYTGNDCGSCPACVARKQLRFHGLEI